MKKGKMDRKAAVSPQARDSPPKIQRPALAKSRALTYHYGVKQKNPQVDYTAYGTDYQVFFPTNSEIIL